MRYKNRCESIKRNILNKKREGHLGFYVLFIFALAFCGMANLLGFNDTYAAGSVSLTVSNSNLEINMASTSSGGNFSESATSTITASTTNVTGYLLNLSSSGNTNLVNSSDSTKTITSISSAISQSDFSSSSSYNNKWGYKPSSLYNQGTGQNVSNTNFRPLPGASEEALAKTTSANATGTSNTYSLSFGARINSQTATGNYTNNTFVIALTANFDGSCDNTKLCVEYEGNGLTYNNDTVNRVNYNSTTTTGTVTKYAHTPNVSDAGVANGTYSSSMNTTDTVTIEGASTLNVIIYYDAESTSYDWVTVYQSPFTISNSNDGTVSNTTGNLSGKLSGRKSGRTTTYSSWYTQTYTVSGDTVKFHFKSDGSGQYYGYYAIVSGTGTITERTVASGEYAVPTGTNALFHGWSSTQTTAGSGLPSDVEYADESEVKTKMPGDEGDTETLYAVWQQGQTITFTKDNNVSSIAVLDSSGTTVGTITSNSQSLILYQGETYTINPTYATRYLPNTFEKTSGVGTFTRITEYTGTFEVGNGSATISVTAGQYVNTLMQNYNCSNLANVGDSTYVYDNRDNEIYLISKLADGKCWMLENLRLDFTDSTILNGLSTSNTHVDSASLVSLRSGNRSAGDQYARDGFSGSNWTESYRSYQPMINVSRTVNDTQYTKNTISPVTNGIGSGKIGVYYNYCAASAGSYCYDSSDGVDVANTLSDAKYDICPAGWRMPTGSSSGEYEALYEDYSYDETTFNTNLSLPFSGYFSSPSLNELGTRGRFWTSTWYDTWDMYNLRVNSSQVSNYNTNDRYDGLPVRCLAMSSNNFTLNFNKNTTDSVSNLPSTQAVTEQNDIMHDFTLPTASSSVPVRSGWVFAGWSDSGSEGIPTYKYDNNAFTPSIVSVNPSDSPKTLYAIWHQAQTITFTFDSNVNKVEVFDPKNNLVGTITSSGSTITLNRPVTYTLKCYHATGYGTNAVTITSGAGTINGKKFTVGAGSATLNITSILVNTIADAGTMQNVDLGNRGCPETLSIGTPYQLTDTRDNETYIVAKLADGNCWMLDNLRLDITNSTILNGLTTSNTHADSASLTSLRSGNRASGARYASSGFVTWDSNNTGEAFNQAKANASKKDYIDSDDTGEGEGSFKYGVYYNFCAASAGSFCYDQGAAVDDPSTLQDASSDLCPHGWRLPTGGDNGEYKALYEAYGSDGYTFVTTFSLPISGWMKSSGSPGEYGHDFGYAWFYSSTYDYEDYVNDIYLYRYDPDFIHIVRRAGIPMRCILDS